jgi:hypothetical protein
LTWARVARLADMFLTSRLSTVRIEEQSPLSPLRRLSARARTESWPSLSRPTILKRMLSAFQKQKISADDIRTLADLKAYRKQFGGRDGHIDESTLTPEQRARIGAILWAEMQANPEQLARVKRECPDLSDADIKRACGITDMTEEVLADVGHVDATPNALQVESMTRSYVCQAADAAFLLTHGTRISGISSAAESSSTAAASTRPLIA